MALSAKVIWIIVLVVLSVIGVGLAVGLVVGLVTGQGTTAPATGDPGEPVCALSSDVACLYQSSLKCGFAELQGVQPFYSVTQPMLDAINSVIPPAAFVTAPVLGGDFNFVVNRAVYIATGPDIMTISNAVFSDPTVTPIRTAVGVTFAAVPNLDVFQAIGQTFSVATSVYGKVCIPDGQDPCPENPNNYSLVVSQSQITPEVEPAGPRCAAAGPLPPS